MDVTAAWVNPQDLLDGATGLVPSSVPDVLVHLVFAIFVLVFGWYLSKVVVRLAGRTVAQHIQRPSVTRTVLRGIRISVLVLAVVVAAAILGVQGPEILVSVGVISAVVAVVLAPLIGSLIHGVFIISDRPFEIGDMIEVTDEGHIGFVEDITIRYTKIFTLENTLIVIPNSEVHTRDVINYSAEDERTRLSVDFEITYESDLEAARRHAERATRTVDGVISGGPAIRIGSARYAAAPTCDILEYADHGVHLQVRFWVDRPYTQTAVRSTVQAAIRRRFLEHGIEFAYPHTHHVFDDTSGIAQVAVGDGTWSSERTETSGTETETPATRRSDPPATSQTDPPETSESDAHSGSKATPAETGKDDGEE